jgi:hypothetical protein
MPKELSVGKPNTRRYTPEEKVQAVRMHSCFGLVARVPLWSHTAAIPARRALFDSQTRTRASAGTSREQPRKEL